MIEVGQEAYEFALPDQDGNVHRLSDYRGRWVVLYFYPKDDTTGCTTEACQFRDLLPDFHGVEALVLGVSADSVKSHKKFAEKNGLPFTLLADEDKSVVNQYGVWGKKKFMGKEYEGILRTTVLIDPEGKVAKVYENVNPDGHAKAVREDLAGLMKKE